MNNDILTQLEDKLWLYMGSHRFDIVIETAKEILKQEPIHRDAFQGLVRSEYYLGQYDTMFEDCKAALRHFPEDPIFYYYMYLYYLGRNVDESLHRESIILSKENIEKAVQFAPENAFYHRQLGEIYLINREPDKAAEELSLAVKLDPDDAEYKSRLALALLRLRKLHESEELVTRALQEDPDEPHVLDTVGMIYILRGELDKAEKFFYDAVKRVPTYNYFRKHIEWIEREKKDKIARESQGKKYTPLYLRQTGTNRFF